MITINQKEYRELRCKNCRKFIVYEYVFAGRIAIQCDRCGELNEFEFRHLNTNENKATINKEFVMKGGEK